MHDLQFNDQNFSEILKSNSGRQCIALPVEFFSTENYHYIFEPNHAVFLEVNELVLKIVSILKDKQVELKELTRALPEYSVEEVSNALNEVLEIQNEGYFQPIDFQRANHYSMQAIKEQLTGKLERFYLNISSRCNLFCSYCLFGGQYSSQNPLNNQTMTWETAEKAIEFFFLHARQDGIIRIDFFGGEPLLAFPLMKRIASKFKEKCSERNQEMQMYISSNGTLMNEEIAEFLIENNIYLQISIDGKKEIHDAKRKFKGTEKGSFDVILKNMQYIFDRNPDYFRDRVKLKAVITYEGLDSDDEEFFKTPLIELLKQDKRLYLIDKTPHYNIAEDEEFFSKIKSIGEFLLKKHDISSIEELLEGLTYKKKYIFYSTFYEFLTLQVGSRLYFNLDEPIPFMKDCMIGIEGCFNVDGSIGICYKSNTFIIGSAIEKTWYFDKIEEFHRKRYSVSEDCKHCFVRRFCKLCYEKISGKEGEFESSIRKYCEFNRNYYRVIFEYMLKVMENNPKLWDVLPQLLEREEDVLRKKHEEKKKLE